MDSDACTKNIHIYTSISMYIQKIGLWFENKSQTHGHQIMDREVRYIYYVDGNYLWQLTPLSTVVNQPPSQSLHCGHHVAGCSFRRVAAILFALNYDRDVTIYCTAIELFELTPARVAVQYIVWPRAYYDMHGVIMALTIQDIYRLWWLYRHHAGQHHS